MRQQLGKIKNRNIPKKPKSVEEVHQLFQQPHIMEKYGYTLDNKHQLYTASVCSADYAFTLFTSKAVLDFVEKNIPTNRKYLLDGTFKSAPGPYYQLLTISIEFKNEVNVLSCSR